MGIGTLNENSLHADLRNILLVQGDRIEVPINGYWIDIVRDDLLIEVQTRNFSAIKKKLTYLQILHPIRLIYPISIRKWITKINDDGVSICRKSPKHGVLDLLFYELVRIPEIVLHPNFSLEVMMIEEEEIQIPNNHSNRRNSWRRKGWSIFDRKLINIIDRKTFNTPEDYHIFIDPIPDDMPFTTKEFGLLRGVNLPLAYKMTYTLRKIGLISIYEKKSRTNIYKKNI